MLLNPLPPLATHHFHPVSGLGIMDAKGGFGIAGHRNNYSTGIRNGNWVEDTIGGKLAGKVQIEGYGGSEFP